MMRQSTMSPSIVALRTSGVATRSPKAGLVLARYRSDAQRVALDRGRFPRPALGVARETELLDGTATVWGSDTGRWTTGDGQVLIL